MRIPQKRFEVGGLELDKGRIQTPEGVTPEVRDLVELANRELELNDRILAEARTLDNTAQDQDPRQGSVELHTAVAGREFGTVRADLGEPARLEVSAQGRNEALLECRKVEGNRIHCDSSYGLPGAVPGFSFRLSPESDQPTVKLDGSFDRREMVYRLGKEDLLKALDSVPADAGVPTEVLADKVRGASSSDLISLQREFSQATIHSGEAHLSMLKAATPFLAVLGLGCAVLASAGAAGVALGLFGAGLAGGYGALKMAEHKSHQMQEAWFGLDKLGDWIEHNATELPAPH